MISPLNADTVLSFNHTQGPDDQATRLGPLNLGLVYKAVNHKTELHGANELDINIAKGCVK